MDCSEKTSSLYKALLAAQADIRHPVKNATNPHLRNKFADLSAVIDITRPVLMKHGLFIQQGCGVRVAENGAHVAHVWTKLVHGESGEWIGDTSEMVVEASKGLNTPQAMGVIHTYLRRYQWAAMCGVYSEDDIDGAGAAGNGNGANARRPFQATNAKGNPAPAPKPFDPKDAAAKCINELVSRGMSNDEAAGTHREWSNAIESDTGEKPGREAYTTFIRNIRGGMYDLETANSNGKAGK